MRTFVMCMFLLLTSTAFGQTMSVSDLSKGQTYGDMHQVGCSPQTYNLTPNTTATWRVDSLPSLTNQPGPDVKVLTQIGRPDAGGTITIHTTPQKEASYVFALTSGGFSFFPAYEFRKDGILIARFDSQSGYWHSTSVTPGASLEYFGSQGWTKITDTTNKRLPSMEGKGFVFADAMSGLTIRPYSQTLPIRLILPEEMSTNCTAAEIWQYTDRGTLGLGSSSIIFYGREAKFESNPSMGKGFFGATEDYFWTQNTCAVNGTAQYCVALNTLAPKEVYAKLLKPLANGVDNWNIYTPEGASYRLTGNGLLLAKMQLGFNGAGIWDGTMSSTSSKKLLGEYYTAVQISIALAVTTRNDAQHSQLACRAPSLACLSVKLSDGQVISGQTTLRQFLDTTEYVLKVNVSEADIMALLQIYREVCPPPDLNAGGGPNNYRP